MTTVCALAAKIDDDLRSSRETKACDALQLGFFVVFGSTCTTLMFMEPPGSICQAKGPPPLIQTSTLTLSKLVQHVVEAANLDFFFLSLEVEDRQATKAEQTMVHAVRALCSRVRCSVGYSTTRNSYVRREDATVSNGPARTKGKSCALFPLRRACVCCARALARCG